MSTFLVVDDDAFLRCLLAGFLTERGARVEIAHDGVQGATQAEEHQPDVVITDFNMPANERGEFILWLRSRWPQMPVIVMSGNTEDFLSGFRAIGCHTIKKPFTLPQLIEVVESAGVLLPLSSAKT